MTIEPEPQADIVPTGEVRAAISLRSRHRPSRKRAYSGASSNNGSVSAVSPANTWQRLIRSSSHSPDGMGDRTRTGRNGECPDRVVVVMPLLTFVPD